MLNKLFALATLDKVLDHFTLACFLFVLLVVPHLVESWF